MNKWMGDTGYADKLEEYDDRIRREYDKKMEMELAEVRKYAQQIQPPPFKPYTMAQSDAEACVYRIEKSLAELGEQFKRLVDLMQKLMEYQIVIPTEEIKKELSKEVK
jgi:hypothetical protein